MKKIRQGRRGFGAIGVAVFVLVTCTVSSVQARQFRNISPIVTPDYQQANLPSGAVNISEPRAIKRSEIEPRLRELIAKWNTPQMPEMLAEQFYDKDRLMDSIGTKVPRDATMRVQSVQAIQTLQQYRTPASTGVAAREVSLVSAIVKTQIEFNGPTGLVRLPGTSEFTLEVIKYIK
jgi:hypothetical protein